MESAYVPYVSRPVLAVDGEEMPEVNDAIIAAMVEETITGLFRCEVTVENFGTRSGSAEPPGYLYFDRNTLDFGKGITLKLGPDAESLFEGRITALEADYLRGGAPRLTLLAEDNLQDMRMIRRSRSFEDLSDVDIIDQIANEHGLQAEVTIEGETHDVIGQLNQSDLAFIRERARAAGADVWLRNGTLIVGSRADWDAGSALRLAYGGSMEVFRVRADLAHQCTELTVTGWDVASKSSIEETVQDDAISTELRGDVSGTETLSSAFGDRPATVVHTVPLTSAEARAIAEARYRERARRFVTGTGISNGDARIRVGTMLELDGLGDLFNGKYYVVRTLHTYDTDTGYRTEFDVERPGIGR